MTDKHNNTTQILAMNMTQIATQVDPEAKMLETGAILGGEFAAHIFVRDDWLCFDDSLYVAARILQILSKTTKTSDEIFPLFDTGVNIQEIKLAVAEERKFELMNQLLEKTISCGESDHSG